MKNDIKILGALTENKAIVKITASIILILSIVFMLRPYIEVDAVNMISSVLGDFFNFDFNLGNGKYSVFNIISTLRKIMVWVNDEDSSVAVSYIIAAIPFRLHIISIVAMASNTLKLLLIKDYYDYKAGRKGAIIAFLLTIIILAGSIFANIYIESESGGYIANVISFCPALFIVMALCLIYLIYIVPKLKQNITISGNIPQDIHKSNSKTDTQKDNVKFWTCSFCGELNDKENGFCSKCGLENIDNADNT